MARGRVSGLKIRVLRVNRLEQLVLKCANDAIEAVFQLYPLGFTEVRDSHTRAIQRRVGILKMMIDPDRLLESHVPQPPERLRPYFFA
jgi:hypothetical protein